MNGTRIELHSRECTCRGGSWALLQDSNASPCSGAGDDPEGGVEKLVLTLKEWRELGKPGSVEHYKETQERVTAGERREFKRYEVRLEVRIARIATWREPDAQVEDTIAEAIAIGGALVRSHMAVEKGEIITFAVGNDYSTRAEVMYVSTGEGPGLDGIQRLGLKFLDAPLPESFIPSDAQPLP